MLLRRAQNKKHKVQPFRSKTSTCAPRGAICNFEKALRTCCSISLSKRAHRHHINKFICPCCHLNMWNISRCCISHFQFSFLLFSVLSICVCVCGRLVDCLFAWLLVCFCLVVGLLVCVCVWLIVWLVFVLVFVRVFVLILFWFALVFYLFISVLC